MSSSWEGKIHSACQEIPRILWDPKFHYHVQKSPALERILRQINAVQTLFLSRTFQCYPAIYTFVYQVVYFIWFSRLKFCIHIPNISCFLYDLSSMLSPPVASYLLGQNILSQHPVLGDPQCTFFPQCKRSLFTAIQNNK